MTTMLTLEPRVLAWARTRSGLSPDELAKKVGAKAATVAAWEATGVLRPKQLERLAKATYTPVGYLYLPEPPPEALPVPDFRTVGGQAVGRPSPALLDVIGDALRKQDWYREYLLEIGSEPLGHVGSITVQTPVLVAAARIRGTIGLDAAWRMGVPTKEAAFRAATGRIEDSGVLVLKSGVVGCNTHRKLSVDEFRGFALADAYAPLVFVNGADAPGGQLFTLAHELVHVWLGVSGVSNLNATYAPDVEIERFCNMVAAELLVPTVELHQQWQKAAEDPRPVEWLARTFKVSAVVIVRRLRDLGYMDEAAFRSEYARLMAAYRALPKVRGGDFVRNQTIRIGRRFARAVVASTLEGRTSYLDAFRLLSVNKVGTFEKLASELKFTR